MRLSIRPGRSSIRARQLEFGLPGSLARRRLAGRRGIRPRWLPAVPVGREAVAGAARGKLSPMASTCPPSNDSSPLRSRLKPASAESESTSRMSSIGSGCAQRILLGDADCAVCFAREDGKFHGSIAICRLSPVETSATKSNPRASSDSVTRTRDSGCVAADLQARLAQLVLQRSCGSSTTRPPGAASGFAIRAKRLRGAAAGRMYGPPVAPLPRSESIPASALATAVRSQRIERT